MHGLYAHAAIGWTGLVENRIWELFTTFYGGVLMVACCCRSHIACTEAYLSVENAAVPWLDAMSIIISLSRSEVEDRERTTPRGIFPCHPE